MEMLTRLVEICFWKKALGTAGRTGGRGMGVGRNNYFLDKLGIALVIPDVRGSSGYGKTCLALDNGFKREDSAR